MEKFNEQEIILHQAAQLIALTGINLLPSLPDDSQNTLVYNAEDQLLIGRRFTLSGHIFSIGIQLDPFNLVLLGEHGKVLNTMNLANCEKSTAIATWSGWLTDLGADADLTTQLHYELPANESYSSENYGVLTAEFVELWHKMRSQGNNALNNLNKLTGIESEVNIWPHHFDTGTYYPLRTVEGEVVASVGAGLAIADSMIAEPYFYIYGYKKNVDINYADVPELVVGKWLTDGWKGAVLPFSELSDIEASSQIDAFFKRSYDFLVAQL